MRSMTGFAEAQCSEKNGVCQTNCYISLHGVNRKHLEIHINTNSSLSFWESQLLTRIKETVFRGQITMTVRLESTQGSWSESANISSRIGLNNSEIQALFNECQNLAASLPNPPVDYFYTLFTQLLISNPIVKNSEAKIFSPQERERLEPLLYRTFDQALKAFQEMRLQEGQNLQKKFLEYLNKFAQLKKTIEDVLPEVQAAAQERAEGLIKETFKLTVDAGIISADQISTYKYLLEEITSTLYKNDIEEELIRLELHINQLNAYFQENLSDIPSGKKIEFYIQELLRETHTIGAKTHSGQKGISQITHAIIEMKDLLDKMREQVQNIE